MTDLTEQWKKGELPSGYYYIKLSKGYGGDGYSVVIVFLSPTSPCYNIETILAPVPSYDEYWHMISCLNDQTEILNENAQLKDLLKECKRYIRPFIKDFTVTMPNEKIFLQELLTKINEVLK